MSMNQYRVKTVSMNGNKYTYTMTGEGVESFRVHIYANGSTRQLYTAKIQAAIMAAMVEQDHAEALEIDAVLNEHNKEIDQLGFLLNAPAQRRKMVERDHAEALAMDNQIDFYAHPEWHKNLIATATREALEINAQVDSELAKLCRVIAGVRRTLYKQETKTDLIGAACRGVIDGLRERLGVVISRDMLPEIVYRAGKLAGVTE